MSNILFRFLFASILLVLTFGSVSQAAIVTLSFSGQITQANFYAADPFSGAITVGTPFTGTYTFDTDTPDSSPLVAGYSRYLHSGPPYGINAQIGGFSGTSENNATSLNYRIITDPAHVHDIQASNVTFGGVNAYLMQIFLRDTTLTALSDTNLSSDPPNLSDYQTKNFFLGIGSSSSADATFTGEVYSISAVPVPAAAWLFGSALLGLVGMGRRRSIS